MKMSILTFVAILAVAFALPVSSAAQDRPSGLVVGDRIRMYDAGNRGVIGTVTAISNDSVFARVERHSRVLLVAGVDSFELSVGHRRHLVAGTLAGTVVGAGIGLMAGVMSTHDCELALAEERYCTRDSVIIGGLTIFGAASGLVLGAIMGQLTSTDRWAPMYYPSGFRPGSHGAGIRIRAPF